MGAFLFQLLAPLNSDLTLQPSTISLRITSNAWKPIYRRSPTSNPRRIQFSKQPNNFQFHILSHQPGAPLKRPIPMIPTKRLLNVCDRKKWASGDPWKISKSLKTAVMRSAGFCERETAAGKAGGCWKTVALPRIFQGALDRHRRSDLSKVVAKLPPGEVWGIHYPRVLRWKTKSARERTKVVNVVAAARVSVHTSCNVTPVHKRCLITVYIQWNKKKVDPERCSSSFVGSSASFSSLPGET